MKLSIAMATYNGAKYLQQQLDSFVAQSRQPDELVVSDDCSMDNTLEILKKFQKKAPFAVHVFSNEINLGYIKNFEKALSLCSGDIAFLSDQDDIWLEDKLFLVKEVFDSNPETMVVINDYYVSDEECKKKLSSKITNIRSHGLSEDWYVAGCATALRAEFLEIVLPIPKSIHGHDSWINKLAIYSNARTILRRPLQLYRRHSSNTSNSIANNKAILPLFSLLKQYGLKDVHKGWRNEIVANNFYIERLCLAKSCNNIPQLSLKYIDKSVAALSNKNIFIMQRIELLGFGTYKRLPKIIRLWVNGFYNHFEGGKSAVKDMLR